ncbi:MAG: hypothetical protein QM723_39460 [Myxococcaceae bacterium]
MANLPAYSLCGPLGAPLDFRHASGRTPAQKLCALLADAYRRVTFFRRQRQSVPAEEWTNARKLCAIAAALEGSADRQELADLKLAEAALLDAFRWRPSPH